MRLKRVKNRYKPGDVVLLSRFAWLPVTVGESLIWLQRYEELRMYRASEVQAVINSKQVIFKVMEWVILSKRFIR